MAYPEAAAERVLDDLCIRDLKDLMLLDEIAYARGATVVDRELRGMEARITIAGHRAVIAISDLIGNSRRRRYSVAHELGHFEMHRGGSSLSLCTGSDISDTAVNVSKSREQEANVFAAALLMPIRFFLPFCQKDKPTLDVVSTLANTFNTSFTATGLRYTQFSDEAVALVFSEAGRIKWFKASKSFEELNLFVPRGERLDQQALASYFFRGQSIPSLPKSVAASAWIDSEYCRPGARIMEHSKALYDYKAVLTLLWVDDDILDDDYFDQ